MDPTAAPNTAAPDTAAPDTAAPDTATPDSPAPGSPSAGASVGHGIPKAPASRPLEFVEHPVAVMRERAGDFLALMRQRRTVRDFADRPVPRDIIETALRTAGTAPSGANQQPWHFVAVADPDLKRRIRQAAEAEEKTFYEGRAPRDWLDALAHIGTDWEKPFLETAPWLIIVFEQVYGIGPTGERVKHYYAPDSVGIATGLLIAALHNAGLATLTHTPAPMKFLGEVLERPANERAFMILVAGYPAEGCRVPVITKKDLPAIATFR